MKIVKSSLLAICTLSVLSTACLKVDGNIPFKSKSSNRVTNKSSNVKQNIGDDKVKLQVMSESRFKQEALTNSMLHVSSPIVKNLLATLPQAEDDAESINETQETDGAKAQEESLLLGFPVGLIGEQNIFGGVITKVSDKDNEDLGILKLTDLTPIHVRTMITGLQTSTPAISLVGCANACDEESQQHVLINFDIVGYNPETEMLIIDLASIGRELDLITMLDPKGEYTQLKAISSATTDVDFSISTLVFDIKTRMIPITADETDVDAPVTEFTVRWYLKLNSLFNPAFTARAPTPGVGFFETSRGANTKITRFSTTNNGTSVHYYIKDVPAEWRKVFASSFDNWNVEFKKVLGRDLLSYEFLETSDPRYAEIIAGDVRYNVMEWDLVNKAGYGGLGPSIANQYTGETFSANVLIQGPTIIDIYTKWFGVAKEVEKLREEGQEAQANALLKKFNLSVEKQVAARKKHTFSLKLGKKLEMNIHAQKAELEDPLIKGHFDMPPAGITYKEYMEGYFTEMLEHELGHNLGLRHNFKGNLGAYETGDKGSVSRSIMEYLGRGYRHVSAIGLYDKMAISYGYRGQAPKHLNWFCTDEDQASSVATMASKSPECSKSDATSDPYSYFEGRIARAIELLVDTKTAAAPLWKVSEIKAQIDDAVTGLSSYALSAERTADTWTNFFGKGDRPESKSEMKDYVLSSIKKKLCDAKLPAIISAKETAEASLLAEKNLVELTAAIAEKTKSFGLYSVEQLGCK